MLSNYIVIPDLHGQLEIVGLVIAHLKELLKADENLVVVFLGDYIDKGNCDEFGCDVNSILVVKELIKFKQYCKQSNYRLCLLKGNHEQLLQNYMVGDDKRVKKIKGVAQTIKAVEKESKKSKQEIINFLIDLKMFYKPRGGKYFFCHAGVPPKYMKNPEKSPMSELLNIRAAFYKFEKKFPMKIIFGHTIFKNPLYKSDRIGLDCGAYRTSEITFLRIEKGVETFYRMSNPTDLRKIEVPFKY